MTRASSRSVRVRSSGTRITSACAVAFFGIPLIWLVGVLVGAVAHVAGEATPGYSPMTAQSRPIMMKKPLKRAIRPSAP